MGLSKKTVHALLASLVFLSLALRYPRGIGELGVDSFVFHGLAQVALDQQHAAWILNTLSLFGLYPLSHPSGPVFLLVSEASMGGMTLQASIVALDFVTAIVGTFTSFMMARSINSDPRFALLVAFLFSLAPRFVGSTMFQIPTRSLFSALIPLFIWAILALRQRPDLRGVAVLGFVLLVMLSSHRLAVLLGIVVAAYVAAAIVLLVVRILRKSYSGVMFRPSSARAMRAGSWILVGIIVVYFLAFTGVLDAYESGRLTEGTEFLDKFQNLVVSLARSSGVLVPLVVIGLGATIHAKNKDIRQPWLAGIFLGLLPTLFLRQYTGAYMPAFVSIFVALGLFWIVLKTRRRPRLRSAVVAASIVAVLVSTVWIVQYDVGLLEQISPSTYDGGLYLRHEAHRTFVANMGLLGAQLNSASGMPYMPIGGATTARQGPEILAFGFVDPSTLFVQLIPLGSVTIEDDSIFVVDGLNLETVWADLLTSGIDESRARSTLRDYSVAWYVESADYQGEFYAYGNVYYSRFGVSVADSCYIAYVGPEFRVFSV